jgi:hypothetical protein
MDKSITATTSRKLSRTAMKQLMGGRIDNLWVCGAKRTIYPNNGECKKNCPPPDECNKFTVQ